MINILTITEMYWPEGSGGTLATHLIINLLSHHNVRFKVITGTKRINKTKGVEYISSDLLRAPTKVGKWLNLAILTRQKWFNKLLSEADVIYIPGHLYLLTLMANILNKKVIFHLHDYQTVSYNAQVFHPARNGVLSSVKEVAKYELLGHNSSAKALLAALLTPLNELNTASAARADELICVSKRQAEIIRQKAPELAKKIRVIYNLPPYVPWVEKNFEKSGFIYVGGSNYGKGIHVLVKAATKFLRYYECNFILTNLIERRWRILLEQLNRKFNKSFLTLGCIRYESLFNIYSKTKALLFPSIWEEAFGYAVLEAMLSGTIPIASRVGGVPEIVRGSPAQEMLFTPGDTDEFLDKMETTFLLSKEQLTEIGIRLRKKVLERFDSERIEQQLLRVFGGV